LISYCFIFVMCTDSLPIFKNCWIALDRFKFIHIAVMNGIFSNIIKLTLIVIVIVITRGWSFEHSKLKSKTIFNIIFIMPVFMICKSNDRQHKLCHLPSIKGRSLLERIFSLIYNNVRKFKNILSNNYYKRCP
jgi:hypothetical protein